MLCFSLEESCFSLEESCFSLEESCFSASKLLLQAPAREKQSAGKDRLWLGIRPLVWNQGVTFGVELGCR